MSTCTCSPLFRAAAASYGANDAHELGCLTLEWAPGLPPAKRPFISAVVTTFNESSLPRYRGGNLTPFCHFRWWRSFMLRYAISAVRDARDAFARGDAIGLHVGFTMLCEALEARDAARAATPRGST